MIVRDEAIDDRQRRFQMLTNFRHLSQRCAWLFIFICTVAATAAHAQSPSQPGDMQFLFAFGAVTGPEGKQKVIAVQNETILRSGDRMKLFIEPKSALHLYLLHLSAEGEIVFLYPGEGQSASLPPGVALHIPDVSRWFQLDTHTGQEKFFLLVSAQPLHRLEKLYSEHVALKEKTALQSSTDSILNEIKQLRLKHRDLSAPAEKPVRIGGSLRGQKPQDASIFPDVTSLASEISAPGGFYGRTFTIDHR
jgi:hypothetical protein